MNGLRNLGRVFEAGKGPWERRLVIWLVAAAIGAVLVVTAAYYFDVATESDAFCGLLCHPNRPEYVAHEVSPHANVECGTCHIGPGLMPKVTAKIFGAGELFKLVTNTYERPIALPVERMRPANVICEQCHSDELLDQDQVLLINAIAADEGNTETRTNLVLRISESGNPGDPAGDTDRNGAHWHIDNPVQYVALDPLAQEIAWVGTMEDGPQQRVVEYQATDVRLTAEQLASLPRQEMDCLDCHNRATHIFRKPEEVLDEALATGRIDRDLPFVKREGLRLLSADYPTEEAGLEAMNGIKDFYRSQYPSVYSAQSQAVDQAAVVLQDIYHRTVFPEMNLTWEAYPDNLGHTDFPGCFRCHDGEHVNAQGEAIPNNCTLCHSVPVVTRPDQGPDPAAGLSFAAQLLGKPDSHQEANFIWDHRILANESCAACHGPIEYGTDNSSFCANEACHGQTWPETALEATFVHPVELIGQHAQALCTACHQGVREPDLADCATCHQPPSEPHFGTECSQCHTPAGWKESAVSWVTGVPSIPHRTGGAIDCLTCHGEDSVKPVPAMHEGIPSESCTHCHQSVPTLGVPVIPHPIEGADTCQACHGEGQLRPASALHQGIPLDSCLYCHESLPVEGVPAIPHTVKGQPSCRVCHRENQFEQPIPADHKGWPNEFCLLCHEPTVAED